MKVSPVNLKSLAYTLDVEGYSSLPVLERCGLPPLDLIDEDGEWVPVERFDELMAHVVEHTGDSSFGLVAGKSLALMRYGHLAPLAIYAPDLRTLLADVARFSVLVLERCEVDLDESNGAARLVVRPVVEAGRSGRFRTELVATSAMQMARFAGGQGSDILEVTFPYACPPGSEGRYAGTFGPKLRFEQPECAVVIDADLLDRPLATHDPVARMAVRTRAESALAAMRARSDTAERVRQALLAALPDLPSLDDTARSLGVSARTLRRQLAALGTTHQALAQECQSMMARRLLAEGQLSIKQVADALGFSSVSTFHRAFRRWAGSTPADWRGRRPASPAQGVDRGDPAA